MFVKDIKNHIKKQTYYFFNNIINIKDFDPYNIKIDEKSYKNNIICYTGHETIKKDLNINCVNPLCLIFHKVNGYFEEINGNKYLTLVFTNESKENVKKNMKNCGVKSEI